MVPSSMLAIATDDEHLSCGGFSLDETIRFGSLEFIANCFSGLSLSPKRDGSDAAFMGSAHSGPPSPQRSMIGDSTEEFHMASDEEEGFDLPSSRRHGVGAPPAPATTISWSENTLTTQAMMLIPLWHRHRIPTSLLSNDALVRGGGGMSASPRSATLRQVGGNATTERASQQAIRHRDPAK
jgi:hypothetical protein